MKHITQVLFSLLTLLGISLAFSTEVKIETNSEREELLPFTAVDSHGRAVPDLKKSEIIFLVNGMNFRGFSVISPGDVQFSSKPQAYFELAKAPLNAYYEIVFPYIWNAEQSIRIQLGTNRNGVYLLTPKTIKKSKSVIRLEDLKDENLALELLRENTWLNLHLASLNLFSSTTKTDNRKKKTNNFYDIHLPDDYINNRFDLFKITFQPDKSEILVRQQFVTPASSSLNIEKGNETYMLLVNRQQSAALVLRNIEPAGFTSEPLANPVKITNEERVKVAAALAVRQKLIAVLQAEVKLIPVEILPMAVQEATKANRESIPEKSESVIAAPQRNANTDTIPIQQYWQLPDSKTVILKQLASYRSELSRTAKIIYCETALNYLKQNWIAKALPYLVKVLDPVPKEEDFVSGLVKKLNRLDQSLIKILAKSNSLAAMNLPKEFQGIRSKLSLNPEKDETERFFADLQKIVVKNREGFDFVRETLSTIPDLLETMAARPAATAEIKGTLSLAPTVADLRKQIEVLLPLQSELEQKTFIQKSWMAEVMGNLNHILAQYVLQADANEKCLPQLSETMAEAAVGFVMANSHAFSKPFKRSFYEKKLQDLGVAKEWLLESSFFEVLLQARNIEKNPQGFWEAAFADDITMIYIPGGSFMMGVPWEAGGAEDESPQHEVDLDAYWLAKTETTFQQYDRFCNDTSRSISSDFGKGRKKRPVIGISYQDAQNYCLWLSQKTGVLFRLPSEAEWEKAARGNDGRKYPWGNTDPDGRHCNYADLNFLEYYLQINPQLDEKEKQQIHSNIATASDDGQVFTAPVGSYSQGASPYGAMDMAGNVWEWVADWYDGNYYQKSPRHNPCGYITGISRVARGGGWDCNYWLLRCTSRTGAAPVPSKGSESLGFRVAASPLQTTHNGDTTNPGRSN